MTTPLSTDDLARLAELLAKATPGPWKVGGLCHHAVMGADGFGVAECWLRSGHDYEATAALIVAAVNALPALLAMARQGAEDAARLDRMERGDLWVHRNDADASAPFRLDSITTGKSSGWHATFRAAIDAAKERAP